MIDHDRIAARGRADLVRDAARPELDIALDQQPRDARRRKSL
jgi:hypothetical protein